jgi:pimeloyl-ACP methyl ester carboxylesterase
VSLYVHRWGEGRRRFVGLHGWSGDHRTFEPLAPFVPADASLLAFDQPGLGRSAPPRGWSMAEFLAPLVAALQAEPGPLTLIGNCSGAVIAMELALVLGPRVERLVLIDPFAYVPWYFALLARGWTGRFFYWVTFANPIGRWITNTVLASKRTEATDLTASFAGVDHMNAHRYLALLCSEPRLERYAAIEAEVDLVHGARSFEAVRRSVELYRALWPTMRVHRLEAAGHLPLQEAIEGVAEACFADAAPAPPDASAQDPSEDRKAG